MNQRTIKLVPLFIAAMFLLALTILGLLLNTRVNRPDGKPVVQNVNFAEIFEEMDEISLQQDGHTVFSLMGLCVDKNHNYLGFPEKVIMC